MSTRMSIFRRKTNLGRAEFQSYWRDVHAPIAVRIPFLEFYEQNCVVEQAQLGDREPVDLDGLCKLRFANDEAMRSVLTPEVTRTLMEDEAKFIEGLRTFVLESRSVVDVFPSAASKWIALVTRRADLDGAAFERLWRTQYGEWVKSLPGIGGYVQNYVTSRTIERRQADYEQLPIDCIDELWFDEDTDLVAVVQARAADFASVVNLVRVTVNAPAIPSMRT